MMNMSDEEVHKSREQRSSIQGPSISGGIEADGDLNIATVLNQYTFPKGKTEAITQYAKFFVEIQSHDSISLFGPSVDETDTTSQFHPSLLLQIRKKLITNRVLILHTKPGVPIELLLRDAAKDLRQWIIEKNSDEEQTDSPPILEYSVGDIKDQGRPEFSFEQKLGGLNDPAILLFPDTSRQQLGWDLNQISKRVTEWGHFIIASTHLPDHIWCLQNYERQFWEELPIDNLYNPSRLEQDFLNTLNANRTSLPYLFRRTFSLDDLFVADQTVQQVACQLRTPVNIASFVSALHSAKKNSKAEEVITLLEQHMDQDTEMAIRIWFGNLSSRDQLLALSLTLLDGLFEDQMFTVVQKMMRSAWDLNPETGTMLDRVDLQNLMNFFEFVPAGHSGARFVGKFDQ